MRFIHAADIHLGAQPDKGKPWSELRSEEIWHTFRKLLDLAEEEKADLLLIAGDLFHRPPLLRELKEVNYLFGKLSCTQVVWIAGNHDHLRPDAPSRTFEWAENVCFLDGKECECVRFEELQTSVYGFSYYQKEIAQPRYDHLRPDTEDGCHILLAHGGDSAHIPIDKRKLARSGFDYVALGHIHKPQVLVENQIAYAGALEPIDVNDTGMHGCILGEYHNGVIQTEFVPLASREYVHLEIACVREDTDHAIRDRLEAEIHRRGRQHFYKVTLTGYRSPDIRFSVQAYTQCGNIVEIIDKTCPDYDFEELQRIHRGDLIGKYIEKLLPRPDDSEEQRRVREQALYYGLDVLCK